MSEQHTTHSNMNMIIGPRSHPTVQIPGDPTANIHSPFSTEIDDYDIPMDAFTSDHFRIYVFKVKKCARAKSHDWIDCPYAHSGEKARRRDPRKFRYSGTACPDYKKGECVRGDACEYAHGVFECWLHPTRYRTQPCKDGVLCRRKICFFAHTADQLRLLSTGSLGNYDGFVTELDDELPSRLGGDSFMQRLFGSPTSTLYARKNESPPISPGGSIGFNSVSELSESMRGLLIGKGCGGMSLSPRGVQTGCSFGSTRQGSMLRPGYSSVPVTPTRKMTRSGLGEFDTWDELFEEEQAVERVESGRDVRAKMYAKLRKENSLDRVDSVGSGVGGSGSLRSEI